MANLSNIDFDGELLEIEDEYARKSISTLQESQKQVETNLETAKENISTLQEVQEQNGTKLTEHTENQYNPHNVTKDQVGLSDVDNTSDINKPVSVSQQAAIDAAYANSNYYTDEKIAALINGAPSTLDTLKEIANAMSEHEDVVKALNDAIGEKANESEFNSHVTNTNNPHGVTKEQVGLNNVPNVATNDQTPTYTDATNNEKLVSGEKLSVAFGKIAKAISSLISHLANKDNPHGVTAEHVGALTPSNVVDSFSSESSDLPLSANRWKILFEMLGGLTLYAMSETTFETIEEDTENGLYILFEDEEETTE